MSLLRTLFLTKFKLPRDVHRFAFRKYPEKTALQFKDSAVTYATLEDRSNRLVQALKTANILQGEVIFMQVDAGPEFFEIRTAALDAGYLLSVFHQHHDAEFIRYAASVAKPAIFIRQHGFGQDDTRGIARDRPAMLIWEIGAFGDYEAALHDAAPTPSENRISPADPMILAFTSGTTGKPKGLITSHKAAIASLKLLVNNLEGKRDNTSPNIALSAIPVFGAGSGLIFPTQLTGGTLVMMDGFSPEKLVTLCHNLGVTRLFVTPSQLIDMLDMPASYDEGLKTLTNIIYGTASTPIPKIEEALLRFGPILQQGYGQAEVLPPVSMLGVDAHMVNGKPAPRDILRSCGKVVKGVKVRIADGTGKALPADTIGEIHVKTPTRFDTYLDPSQNEGAILDHGYFKTGDIGYLDPNGFLHVLDREGDIIHTGSGSIYPRVIEDIAHDHPAVKECCLVEIDGQVQLFTSLRRDIERQNHAAVRLEIQGLLKSKLPDWQTPSQVTIIPQIPRSFLGKVLRRQVKLTYAQPKQPAHTQSTKWQTI